MLTSNECIYMNPCKDLIEGYSSLLGTEDKKFLKNVINYKTDIKSKCKLVFDLKFRRESIISTIFFKISIVFNRF